MNRVEALSPLNRTLLISTVLILFLLIVILIAELSVRTRMYVKYGTFWGFEVKALDEATGLELPKPNSVAGPVKINSIGFRSPELTDTTPSNNIRLAFLGGSTTFCQEVSSNDLVWASVLTSSLQSKYPDQHIDYINASATALDVNNSLTNLEKRVSAYSPDVIFIYHAVNDISNNSWKLANPNYVYSWRYSSWFVKLKKASLLVQLVYTNVLILLQDQKDIATNIIPFDSRMADIFRADLQALVSEALKVSELVVIPTFTNQLRREQNDERRLEAAVTHLHYIEHLDIDGMLQAFDSYNSVIREFSSHENILVIETESAIDGTPENFVDSVHFTDTGSTKMGKHLAIELSRSKKFQALLDK